MSYQFRLVDVDAVLLGSPLDYLIIDEPLEFKSVPITLKRTEFHGVDFEFSAPDYEFGFDYANYIPGQTYDARDFLNRIFDSEGPDGNIYLEFYRNDVLQFRGNIVFASRRLSEDGGAVFYRTKRVNFDELLNSRIGVDADFDAVTGLEGNTLSDVNEKDLLLHSRVINIAGALTQDIARNTAEYSDFGSGDNIAEGLFGLNSVANNELNLIPYEPFVRQPSAESILTGSVDWQEEKLFTYKVPAAGSYGVSIAIEATFNVVTNLLTTGNRTLRFRLGVFNASGLRTVNEIFYTSTAASVASASIDVSASFSDSYELNVGDEVYLYWTYVASGDELTSVGIVMNEGNSFSVDGTTTVKRSTCKAYYPWEAGNRILEYITGHTNVLSSAFFDRIGRTSPTVADNGGGAFTILTNGEKIRKLVSGSPVTDAQYPMLTNWSDFMTWAESVFGLGMAVVTEDGEEKVLIQRYEDFYTEKLIIELTNVSEWEESVDLDLLWNEAEIGYQKSISGDEVDRTNTLDEFNTIQKLLSPLKRIKNKKTFLSPYIASMYAIELTRREQFSEKPTDKWKYDKDVFMVAATETDTVFDVELSYIQSENKIIIPFVLNGIESATTITKFVVLSPVEYTIVSITYTDTTTVIVVNEAVPGTTEEAVYIQFDVEFLTAESNAPFALGTLSGVISPSTIYNGRHNPKYMLFNQAPLLNSGLYYREETDEVITTSGDNLAATFQFGSLADRSSTLDPERLIVGMGANIDILSLDLGTKIFRPLRYKFKTQLPFDTVLYIRDAMLNQNEDDVNYGYIRATNFLGSTIEGYIMEMTYNPLSEEVYFDLRSKTPDFSDLDFILQEQDEDETQYILDEIADGDPILQQQSVNG